MKLMEKLKNTINNFWTCVKPETKHTHSPTLSRWMKSQMREGEKGEKIAIAAIERLGYEFVSENTDGRFDLVFKIPNQDRFFTVEVKYHPASAKYNNLFFELEAYGKPADLFGDVLEADLMVNVYYSPTDYETYVNFLTPEDTKNAILEVAKDIEAGKLPKRHYVEGISTDSSITGYAVPVKYIDKYSLLTLTYKK